MRFDDVDHGAFVTESWIFWWGSYSFCLRLMGFNWWGSYSFCYRLMGLADEDHTALFRTHEFSRWRLFSFCFRPSGLVRNSVFFAASWVKFGHCSNFIRLSALVFHWPFGFFKSSFVSFALILPTGVLLLFFASAMCQHLLSLVLNHFYLCNVFFLWQNLCRTSD
jgi:hypothetical protein